MSVFAEHEKFVWHWKELLHHCKKHSIYQKTGKNELLKKGLKFFIDIYNV